MYFSDKISETEMPEIINQQRKIKIEADGFKKFAEQAADAIKEAKGKDLTVAFVSDRRIRELNNIFRDKNRPTDVLSFPYEPDQYDYLETENFLGDIVISVEQAQRQAKENNLTLENEIKQLILHGILHLVGYDHESDGGEMNRLELKLRRKLKV
jgi:probable rRNA maturation factor